MPEVDVSDDRWSFWVSADGGDVTAAAAVRQGEYIFGRRGSDNGMQKAADIGARRSELEGRDPSEWDELDTYRPMHFGVGREEEWRRISLWQWESAIPSRVQAVVLRLVRSGLSAPADVSTFSWPSRAESVRHLDVDPDMRAIVQAASDAEHQEAVARNLAADAARAQARVDRALAEFEDNLAAEEDAEWHAVVGLLDVEYVGSTDLADAVLASCGSSYLKSWGEAIVKACGAIAAAAPSRLGSTSLLRLMRDTAELRTRPVNPFAGYLEAPKAVIEAYQRHGNKLVELGQLKDSVLDVVLYDVVEAFLDGFNPRITWGVLASHGGSRERPPAPSRDELDEFM